MVPDDTVTAIHEAAHAVMALLVARDFAQVKRVSILPEADYKGIIEFEEKYDLTFSKREWDQLDGKIPMDASAFAALQKKGEAFVMVRMAGQIVELYLTAPPTARSVRPQDEETLADDEMKINAVLDVITQNREAKRLELWNKAQRLVGPYAQVFVYVTQRLLQAGVLEGELWEEVKIEALQMIDQIST